jgi:hypothetical protein
MALARLRDHGGAIPMAVAGASYGTPASFSNGDPVVAGILQRIAQLRDEKQQEGAAEGQQQGNEEPELTPTQAEHAANLARMLGQLEQWGGPRW